MMKTKNKRFPWWAKLLMVVLAVVIVFLCFSYGMIRYFVGDTLGFKGILSMVSYGGFDCRKASATLFWMWIEAIRDSRNC